VAGDGLFPFLDTPFGRITGMICFDADFPALARQVAELRADLLLVAANDWAEIEEMHADMAIVRRRERRFPAAGDQWRDFCAWSRPWPDYPDQVI
jgi:apolipoprotein N-acyltransferase